MLPAFIVNNSIDLRLSDPISFAYLALRQSLRAQLANLNNNFGGYFGVTSIIASLIVRSTFRNFVLHVIPFRSQKQMVRSDAVANIAFMKNLQAFWDLTEIKLPRNTVRGDRATFDLQSAIPVRCHGASPKPTFVYALALNILPETLHNGSWLARIRNAGIVTRDKSRWLSLNVTKPFVAQLGNRSRLTTSTFAEFWGIMGIHQKLAFLVSSLGTFDDVAGALRVRFTRVIIPRIDNFEHFGKAWIRRRADLLKEASK